MVDIALPDKIHPMEKTFEHLYDLDISSKVKKNNGLDYLNWLDCLLLLRSLDMAPSYDVSDIKELSSGQIIVKVWVEINNDRRWITYTDSRSRDFEFIKQRAFVKCVAINWGLGLGLWDSPSDPAVDEKGIIGEITKVCGQLIGPKFIDNDALMEYVLFLPGIGQKISEMKGKDNAIKFGKFIESGSIEDRSSLLMALRSLLIDEPF